MAKEETMKIYFIEHEAFNEGDYVVAESVREAIDKFLSYYSDDYDIVENKITSVTLFKEMKVII